MGFASKIALAALGAGVAQCAVAVPNAAAAPRLVSVSYSGNGCPDGTQNMLSGSAGTLSLVLPQFSAALNGPQDPQSRTSNCQAHLTMDDGIPGWALTIKSISGEGMMYATPNVTLQVYSTVFWSEDASNTITQQTKIENDDEVATLKKVSFKNEIPFSFVSPCVGSSGDVGILNVNLRALLRGSDAKDVGVFIGEEDFPVTEHIEFAWTPCGEKSVDFETPSEEEEEDDEADD